MNKKTERVEVKTEHIENRIEQLLKGLPNQIDQAFPDRIDQAFKSPILNNPAVLQAALQEIELLRERIEVLEEAASRRDLNASYRTPAKTSAPAEIVQHVQPKWWQSLMCWHNYESICGSLIVQCTKCDYRKVREY